LASIEVTPVAVGDMLMLVESGVKNHNPNLYIMYRLGLIRGSLPIFAFIGCHSGWHTLTISLLMTNITEQHNENDTYL
jgi:hypothetical protein